MLMNKFKKIIVSITWAGVALLVFNQIIFTVLSTLIFYKKESLTDSSLLPFSMVWGISNSILIPSLLILFLILGFKKEMLPFTRTGTKRVFTVKMLIKILFSSLAAWIIAGLCPFILMIVLSAIVLKKHVILFIPGGVLYLEILFLFLLYKRIKKQQLKL